MDGDKSSEDLPNVSCARLFDAMYFCAGPFHQFESIHRTGQLDGCVRQYEDLKLCMKARVTRDIQAKKDLLNQISFRKRERYVNPIWQLKPTPAWYTDEQTPADTPTPKQP